MTNNERDQLKHEKSVYNVRIRNLIGIFGMLLLFNIITFSPYIIASLIGLIVGLENIPTEVYATVLVLFLLSNVTNSVIQSYFRRDLRESIAAYSKMLAHHISNVCSKCCLRTGGSESKAERGSNYLPEINFEPDCEDSKGDGNQRLQTNSESITEIGPGYQHNSKLSVTVERSPDPQTTVSMETTATDLSSHKSGSPSLNSLQLLDSAPPPDHSTSNESDTTTDCTADV